MTAYYNEIDPFAAAWLRELIKAGLIAPGDVDERSIEDVTPSDLMGYIQCHFFAGIGGWSRALRLAGWYDDRPAWTGSCPCQPFSAAGKRGGFADERHLWPAWFWLIGECRPDVIFGEQVASADGRAWLDVVLSDLEGANYTVGASDLCAAGVGAPHGRQRLWLVADAQCSEWRQDTKMRNDDNNRSNARRQETAGRCELDRPTGGFWATAEWLPYRDGKARPTESGVAPLAHGIPGRVGRLRGYGNAIVPQVAAEFIGAYLEVMEWPASSPP